MTVTDCVARFIIGPGGKKINQIERDTFTLISIETQDQKNVNRIMIRGTKENVERAKVLFQEFQDAEHVMTITEEMAGYIIRPGGRRIKQISADSGAYINIEGKKTERKVIICGEKENVEMAKMLLQVLLNEYRGSKEKKNKANSFDDNKETKRSDNIEDKTKLFVGGLSWKTTQQTM